MNAPTFSNHQRSQGFVLVTSLIFLVIITLLAVSAMNSSTLQERMASNLREKSRALQAADAGLRVAESFIRQPAFDTLPQPQSTLSVTNTDASGNKTSVALKIWARNRMLPAASNANDPAAFLDPTVWTGSATPYQIDAALSSTGYFIEYETCVGRDLNPDRAATCDGTAYFRITARATGENPAAAAVTQSVYKKSY